MQKERWRDLLLLAVSYFFYMAWYWEYSGLLALSTLVDFLLGLAISRTEDQARRKRLLLVSLALNLGVLATFKYFNFFAEISTSVITFFGTHINLPRSKLLLPVGISFYTFQSLSYTIDVYRRTIPAEKNFTKFALYVSFFPQLVAGPIVRAVDFLPQLRKPISVGRGDFDRGLALVFIGLFKKVIIGDTLAVLAVDAVFKNPTGYSSWDLLIALYSYAFQIYCDFSGYSDMAIGCAGMMGFWLPMNFNRPYLSQNMREFWTRWHMSLSTWLKDYLYISMGGNRKGESKTRRNLLVTMLLGGLWHGAALNFILWGAWHGILLAVTPKPRKDNVPSLWSVWFGRFLTFQLVCFGWLLFRVSNMSQFVTYMKGLLRFQGGTVLHIYVYIFLILAFALHVFPKKLQDHLVMVLWPTKSRWLHALVYAALLLLSVGFTLDAPAFIYFQF